MLQTLERLFFADEKLDNIYQRMGLIIYLSLIATFLLSIKGRVVVELKTLGQKSCIFSNVNGMLF